MRAGEHRDRRVGSRNSSEQRRQREKNEAEGRGPRRDSSARAAPVRVHQGHADDRVVDAQGAGEGAGAVRIRELVLR